jgi:hypothetical protein
MSVVKVTARAATADPAATSGLKATSTLAAQADETTGPAAKTAAASAQHRAASRACAIARLSPFAVEARRLCFSITNVREIC